MLPHISIPKPCTENWHTMSPAEQGKFCNRCSKVVMDFTSMSKKEIITYIEQQKGTVCGRLRRDQLNNAPTLSNKLKRFLYALAFVFFPFISVDSFGQASNKSNNDGHSVLIKKLPSSNADSLSSENEILKGLKLICGIDSSSDKANATSYMLDERRHYYGGFNCGTVLGSAEVKDHFINIKQREWKGPIR